MFSQKEKQHIAAEVEKLLLSLNHPEMPKEFLRFKLHVDGKEAWSWADIEPNWKYQSRPQAHPNAWNEQTHEEIARLSPALDLLAKNEPTNR